MKKILLIIPLVVLVFGYAFFRFFVVKQVFCTQFDGSACPQKLLTKLKEIEGTSFISGWHQANEALQKTPYIDQFLRAVSGPQSISVRIRIRKPDIAIKPDNSELYSVYTRDGVFVDEVSQTQLPIIFLHEQVKTEQVPFISTLGYELNQLMSIQSTAIIGSSMKITISDGKTLIYPLTGDIDSILGATVLTFSQLNQNDGKLIIKDGPTVIHEIDFRFKNPILR